MHSMKSTFLSLLCFLLLFTCLPTIVTTAESYHHFADLDGIINENEYENSILLDDNNWGLYYTIVKDIVKVGIKTKTKGWSAFGIDPEEKMKGADIIQGWISNNEAQSTDTFATKAFGPHPLDTDLGGTNDIKYYSLTQQGEYLHFEFRRNLVTDDRYDKPFPKEGVLRFIWAYGSSSNGSSIHSHRGYGFIPDVSKGVRAAKPVTMKVLADSIGNYQILDVSPAYNQAHIATAKHCTLDTFFEVISSLNHTTNTVVYGVPNDVKNQVLDNLLFYDFRKVYFLNTTIEEWEKAGYPIEKGQIEKVELKFYIGSKKYYINNQMNEMDVSPQIVNGRTFLPIIYITKPLGAISEWHPKEKKVTVLWKNIQIDLWIDKPYSLINGEKIWIDDTNHEVSPYIAPPGRTMIPLRFVSENLGCKVHWDPTIQEITIVYSSIQ